MGLALTLSLSTGQAMADPPAQRSGDLPHLPEAVKARHPGQTLRGTYKICIDPSGNVSAVTPIIRIPEADDPIMDALRTWTFQAQPAPVCLMKVFEFVVEAPVQLSYLPTESYTLRNGLRVLLHTDRRSPQVVVHLCYHAGSGAELPGKSGLARLARQLFYPAPDARELAASQAGVFIDFDRTDAILRVPAQNLATAVATQANHMYFFTKSSAATWINPDMNRRRPYYLEERQQTLQITPFAAAEERVWRALFPPAHPYHGFNHGVVAEVESATTAEVRAFIRRSYGPAAAVLALVGDFESTEAKRLVEKYFETVAPGPDPALRPRPPAPAAPSGEVVLRHRESVASYARLDSAWPSAPALSQDDAAAELLARILTSSRAGRLSRRLDALESVLAVSASQQSLRQLSVLRVTIDAVAGADLPALLAQVDAALDDLRRDGPTADEVAWARAGAITARMSKIDDLTSKALLLQTYQLQAGQPDWLSQDLARFDAVTAQDVQRLVATQLRPERRVVLLAQPERSR